MIPKRVFLGDSGKNKFRRGIKYLAGAVGSTLGPYGRPVIMESEQHIGQKVITKDGVSVAKAIQLYDPVENLAVNIVKEASLQTAKHAGDGTTTSIVLTEALINEADNQITEQHNPTLVARYITQHVGDIIERLGKLSKSVTKRRLQDIAFREVTVIKAKIGVLAVTKQRIELDAVHMRGMLFVPLLADLGKDRAQIDLFGFKKLPQRTAKIRSCRQAVIFVVPATESLLFRTKAILGQTGI